MRLEEPNWLQKHPSLTLPSRWMLGSPFPLWTPPGRPALGSCPLDRSLRPLQIRSCEKLKTHFPAKVSFGVCERNRAGCTPLHPSPVSYHKDFLKHSKFNKIPNCIKPSPCALDFKSHAHFDRNIIHMFLIYLQLNHQNIILRVIWCLGNLLRLFQ